LLTHTIRRYIKHIEYYYSNVESLLLTHCVYLLSLLKSYYRLELSFQESNKMKRYAISTVLFFLFFNVCNAWPADIYVNGATGNDANNGSDCAAAKKSISQALVVSVSGASIRVAQGVYMEAITMKSGVALYGGYAGSGALRDIAAYSTTIDGSNADGGNSAEHVVAIEDVTSVRLDGFTITGGGTIMGDGGGIWCNNTGINNTIMNCTISGNKASLGDGVYCYNSSPTLVNCVISDNSHFLFGGTGVELYSNSNPHLINCTISNHQGCGVCCYSASPTFTNCIISGNVDDHDVFGGGLFFQGCNAQLVNCIIRDNKGHIAAGGVNCSGSFNNISLTNCIISNNRSGSNTGGLKNTGNEPSSLILNDCIISGNEGKNGGGLYGSATLTNCIVSGNHSSGNGGGMLGNNGLTLTNCTISGNTADKDGGGVCSRLGETKISNTIFHDNTSNAIYGMGTIPVFSNCLFYNNPDGDYSYKDGPVYTGAAQINSITGASNNVDGDPRFVMSTMGAWDSSPTYDATSNITILVNSDAFFTPGALANKFINTNISQRRQAMIIGNTTTTVEISGDVTDWTHVGNVYQIIDYHLFYNSAAIDMGTSVGAPAADIEGVTRPIDRGGIGEDLAYDIGAYEEESSRPERSRVTAASWPLDFGNQGILEGPSATREVVVTNVGFGILDFVGNGFELTGQDAGEFTIISTLNTPVPPGASRNLELIYDPSTTGAHRAYLTITTDDPFEPITNVPLRGIGIGIRGDIFPDGKLSSYDLLAFSLDWHRNETDFPLVSDLTNDGTVKDGDLLELIDLIRKRQ
jgi:parallel beta-helix repeat protein